MEMNRSRRRGNQGEQPKKRNNVEQQEEVKTIDLF